MPAGVGGAAAQLEQVQQQLGMGRALILSKQIISIRCPPPSAAASLRCCCPGCCAYYYIHVTHPFETLFGEDGGDVPAPRDRRCGLR